LFSAQDIEQHARGLQTVLPEARFANVAAEPSFTNSSVGEDQFRPEPSQHVHCWTITFPLRFGALELFAKPGVGATSVWQVRYCDPMLAPCGGDTCDSAQELRRSAISIWTATFDADDGDEEWAGDAII